MPFPKGYVSKDHVAVRLDSETLSRIDALKAVFTTSWHQATRSDVLRGVIRIGLESFEQAYGVAAKQHKATEQTAAKRAPTGSRRPAAGKKLRSPARTK